MLKTRIMPTLLYKDFGLVKGVGFNSWRRVGSVMQSIKVYNLRQVDELVFLDIQATNEGRSPDLALIDELADECFMPLAVGGGVQSLEDVRNLLNVGADKVVINTAAVRNPKLVKEISQNFGSQCVVISLDVKRSRNKTYEIYTNSATQSTGLELTKFARLMERMGAGEILITAIEQDGTCQGYDLECIRQVSNTVMIPVIASGGAGSYQHMLEAINLGAASAIAAASIFHFTHQTPLEAKNFLKEHGVHVRI